MKNRIPLNSRSNVLGIDVGGTNTVFSIVAEDGTMAVTGTVKTQDYPTAEELFHAIKTIVSTWDHSLVQTLQGVGIGVPNGNYYTGEVLAPPNLLWSDIHLVPFIQSLFDLQCVITNDANAAALGEMYFGQARNMKHFIALTLGTGLGSGLVVNGKVVYGHDGLAGELGHLTVVPEGRVCGCGRRGCLETYVSAPGLVRTATEIGWLPTSGSATARAVFDAAQEGDSTAREAFNITGMTLGQAMANMVAVLSPEAIILSGGLAQAGESLLEPAQAALEDHVMRSFRGKTRFLLSALDNESIAVQGAAALIYQEHRTPV